MAITVNIPHATAARRDAHPAGEVVSIAPRLARRRRAAALGGQDLTVAFANDNDATAPPRPSGVQDRAAPR
jgi:hypothetical protein